MGPHSFIMQFYGKKKTKLHSFICILFCLYLGRGGQFGSFDLHLLIPQSLTSLKVAPNIWNLS